RSFPATIAPSRFDRRIASPDATRTSFPSILGAPPSQAIPVVVASIALLVRFEFEARHWIPTESPVNVFESTTEDEFRSWTPRDPPVNVLFVRVTEDAFSTFTPIPLPVRRFPSNSIGGYSEVGSWKYPIALSWRLFQLKQFRRRVLKDFAPYLSLKEIS